MRSVALKFENFHWWAVSTTAYMTKRIYSFFEGTKHSHRHLQILRWLGDAYLVPKLTKDCTFTHTNSEEWTIAFELSSRLSNSGASNANVDPGAMYKFAIWINSHWNWTFEHFLYWTYQLVSQLMPRCYFTGVAQVTTYLRVELYSHLFLYIYAIIRFNDF